MLINPLQNVAFQFSLVDSTGAAANADSTPSVTIAIDGVDTEVVATVTNPATGDYKVAFMAGEWTAMQQVQARADFTMGGVASAAKVWSAAVSALATATAVAAIPTNPLLTNDNRIPATAPPTNTQFETRTKLAADYADKATLDVIADDVAGLDGAAMRGTDGAYTGTPPTAEQNAAHVRTELAAELGRIDAAITTRHAAGVKLPATIAAGDIAANAIDAASVKADAATKLATAVWSALTSGLTTAGSIGKWIIDKLNAPVSGMSTTVVVSPVSVTVSPGQASAHANLVTYQHAALNYTLTIRDSDGTARNFSDKTLRMQFFSANDPDTELFAIATGGSSDNRLTVDGADSNVVTVKGSATITADPRTMNWRLVNVTDSRIEGTGVIVIEAGPSFTEDEDE